jgi:hypothetical protein
VADAQTTDLDLEATRMLQTGSSELEVRARIEAIKQLRSSGRKRRVDLWLDPHRGYGLIRRVESTEEGKVICKVAADAWEQFGNDKTWLPRTCTIRTYVADPYMLKGFADAPERTDSIELQDVTFGPARDISFALDYGPGTWIEDRSSEAAKASKSGQLSYIQADSLSKLRDAATFKRRWPWLMVINLLLLVALGAMAYRKYRTR